MSDDDCDEIERELERDRMQLARSLSELHERLTPSALVEQGKVALAAQAAPLLSRLDHAVRAQPVVAAVAGVALAALILGRHRQTAEKHPRPPEKFEALTRWEDEGGPPLAEPVDPEEEWLTRATGLRARAVDLLRQIDHAVLRGLTPAAELARHRAAVMGAFARDTGAALGHGLEGLTEAARTEALEARERVYSARMAATAKGREVVENYPLAAGMAMAAAGAAVACMFPPTEMEDRLMGDARDKLVDDATAAARAEVTRASDLAQELKSAMGRDIERARLVLRPEDAWGGAGVRH